MIGDTIALPLQKMHDQELIVKMVKTLVIFLVLIGYAASAVATDSTSQVIRRQAPKGITSKFYACIDKAGSDTVATGTCLSAEKKNQDTRLNTTYKALSGKLEGKGKDGLLNAERAWLEFHEKTDALETALYGDETVADLQVMQNEVFRLCERANTLDKYLAITNDK